MAFSSLLFIFFLFACSTQFTHKGIPENLYSSQQPVSTEVIDTNAFEIVTIIITALIGMFGISAALEGYVFRKTHVIECILFAVAGLMLIFPEPITDIVGLVLITILVVVQYLRKLSNKDKGKKNPSQYE